MNTFMLRRFISLTMVSAAALALISLLVATAAQAGAEPPEPADTAASAAPSTVEEMPDHPEDWNGHHPGRSHHRKNGNDLVNIGHDSTLREGETADAVVSVLGSSTSDGSAGDVVSILGDTRVTGEVSDSAVAVLG